MDKRFVLSVVAVFFASMLLGMVVHGMLLASDYQALTARGMFRSPEDAQAHFPYMIAAHVILAIGYTWIYRQGRDGRPWLMQGVRFGLAVALITAVPTYLIYFAVQPMPSDMVAKQIAFDLVSVVILGIVTAAVNRERTATVRGAAAAPA